MGKTEEKNLFSATLPVTYSLLFKDICLQHNTYTCLVMVAGQNFSLILSHANLTNPFIKTVLTLLTLRGALTVHIDTEVVQ
jgi:hypothetical protein